MHLNIIQLLYNKSQLPDNMTRILLYNKSQLPDNMTRILSARAFFVICIDVPGFSWEET
jgi:hypothetical protein